MDPISRRDALHMGTGVLAAGFAGRAARAADATGWPLRPANYDEVTLSAGLLRDQFLSTQTTLLAMNEDALLKPFRQKAGLPAPGADFGGWYNPSADFHPHEDMHGFIPGHSFGQYMSALSRSHAITGDPKAADKVRRMVAGLAPTITSRFYDGYPLPCYTYDKTSIGLLDAHSYVQDKTALTVLNKALDAALPHFPAKAMSKAEAEALPHPNVAFTFDESYTLPENLYLAYQRGAGTRFRTVAAKYLQDDTYFNPLSRGENVLPGLHAYSHVNALNSAMLAWRVDGSEKHLHAAKNGMDFVLEQSWVTGGWGPNEGFFKPGSGKLGEALTSSHSSFETPCGAYGHFKIGRNLISATGESRFGDSMERILYNTVSGALPLKPDGTAFYYADYNERGSKFYHPYKCNCCSGTIGQVTADYGISSYFVGARDVFVNLYLPSRFQWKRAGNEVRLTQTTQYPLASEIAIAVDTHTPEEFSIGLRIPAWAGPATRVTVNGQPVAAPITAGSFLHIQRRWQEGDRIALTMDMPLRVEAVDAQHPDRLAVVQGPLALFAVGDRFQAFQRRELTAVRQTSPGAPEWRVATSDGIQIFKPYFAIGAAENTRLYQPVPV
ncbi:MAG TPA: beta-L-arabinofuranosidase domain-containing protein [Rhizomicrobium sp.]|nr:beta-L-arabinofuranosidase domain-containing protein [Rhizomicrobium sp.]